MQLTIPLNKVPITIYIEIETDRPQTLYIIARDLKKPFTYYYRRKVTVNGVRHFNLKMPVSPPLLSITIKSVNHPNMPLEEEQKIFKIINFEPKTIKKNPIWLTELDREFLDFAKRFSENASIYSSGKDQPHIYRSDKGNFVIDYYHDIKDRTTGARAKTPARIGHETGIIEVSKRCMLKYTVPMRITILLHEYSHKFKNPQIKRDITDETGADINALRIALSDGFSESEVLKAFGTVFKNSRSPQNDKRFRIVYDFVDKFVNGYFSNAITEYKR